MRKPQRPAWSFVRKTPDRVRTVVHPRYLSGMRNHATTTATNTIATEVQCTRRAPNRPNVLGMSGGP
jgi:hypothetical protein